MAAETEVPIIRIGDTLIVPVQFELHDRIAEAFQERILVTISKTGARNLVIDVSVLDVVDTYVARVLVETGRMARLMGVDTTLVGIRPEVAAMLVRMGYPMEGVRTALNVDDVLELVRRDRVFDGGG
jgi:rsbT antagonist protein RsbS